MNNNINNENPKNIDLTTIITTAIQIPGIKITREAFFFFFFKDKDQDTISLIIKNGPVVAGCGTIRVIDIWLLSLKMLGNIC